MDKQKNRSMRLASALIGLVIVSILLIGGLKMCSKKPDAPAVINLRLTPVKTTIYPGQLVVFDVTLRSTSPTGVRFLATLRQDNEPKLFIPDTINISKNITKRYKITIPNNFKNGTYYLDVEVNYSNRHIIAQTPVFVRDIPGAPVPIKAQDLEKTIPVVYNFTPPKQEKNKTEETIVYNVTDAPPENIPPEALAKCDEERQDKCIAEYAVANNLSKACSAITDRNTKDTCYIHFIGNGELDLCKRVAFRSYRGYCEAILASRVPAQSLGMIWTYALEMPPINYTVETIEEN